MHGQNVLIVFNKVAKITLTPLVLITCFHLNYKIGEVKFVKKIGKSRISHFEKGG